MLKKTAPQPKLRCHLKVEMICNFIDVDERRWCVMLHLYDRTPHSTPARYSKAKAYPLNPSPQICPTQAGAVTDL